MTTSPASQTTGDTTETPIYTLHHGRTPLLVSVPHAGRRIPEDLHLHYVPRALDVEDTDWCLDELYAFVRNLGASLLVPRHARYVIDLNRPPGNAPMYPGVNNTELCPTRFFTGDPLYQQGQAPDDAEVARRLQVYWQPYHQALQDELLRIKSQHGHAVLFDAHSIKSRLPWLFEGQLPDLNLGTVNGHSCAATLRAALTTVLQQQNQFTHVVDGRFKGGYITRHYGRPDEGVHAVQLEKCWRCYMPESPPYGLDAAHVARVMPILQLMVQTMIDWTPQA